MDCIPSYFNKYTSRLSEIYAFSHPSANVFLLKGKFYNNDYNKNLQGTIGLIQIGKFGTGTDRKRMISISKLGTKASEIHQAINEDSIRKFDEAFQEFQICMELMKPTMG